MRTLSTTKGPREEAQQRHLAVTLNLEPFSRNHQIIYLGKGNGWGGREGSTSSGLEGWPEPGLKPPVRSPGSSAGPRFSSRQGDPALLTLQSWNADIESAGQRLGPLEDRKVQHEERWSFPTENGRYIAKSLILFLKKKKYIPPGLHTDCGPSWARNPTILNKVPSLDLFLKEG